MNERAVDRVAHAAGRVAGEVADRLAPLRDAGWRALGKRDGAVVSVIRKVNDALGRPLAPAAELEDRRAFARGYKPEGAAAPEATPVAAPAAAAAASKPHGEVAPVLVYFMDKQRRDVPKLTDILDVNGIPYKLASLEDDPAAQAAVRRDSKGFRLPLVFVAGECLGGREQVLNAAATGHLAKLVFGG
ncbi:MAG TPA: hypothetical protein VHE35_34860 [Kofleriaceae bacterium]|nr:hypothetical protein [Kofleriaceae bacterium]